jgi:hypothetical protein
MHPMSSKDSFKKLLAEPSRDIAAMLIMKSRVLNCVEIGTQPPLCHRGCHFGPLRFPKEPERP